MYLPQDHLKWINKLCGHQRCDVGGCGGRLGGDRRFDNYCSGGRRGCFCRQQRLTMTTSADLPPVAVVAAATSAAVVLVMSFGPAAKYNTSVVTNRKQCFKCASSYNTMYTTTTPS